MLVALFVEIMDLFGCRSGGYTRKPKFPDIDIRKMAAWGISIAIHTAACFVVGSGSNTNGIAKYGNGAQPPELSPQASRVLTVRLRQPETAESPANITTHPLASSAPLAPSMQDLQTAEMQNKSVKPARQAEKEDAIFQILAVDQPYYFREDQLSAQPFLVRDVDFPQGPLFGALTTQAAVLRLMIGERGEIDEVVIEQSPLSGVAAEMLKDTFSKLRFRPGMIDGMPVRSQMTIEVKIERTVPSPELQFSAPRELCCANSQAKGK
jgi:hypothetical protein